MVWTSKRFYSNQLRYKAKQSQSTSNEPNESTSNNITSSFSSTAIQHARYTSLYRAKETNIKSLELLVEKIEKDIFYTAAVRNVQPNLSKEEKEALKEISPGITKLYVFKTEVPVLSSQTTMVMN